tara:strand:+ start:942 stop:1175 length:234 start_codon:yes stop_codon:yes gene_type:complete
MKNKVRKLIDELFNNSEYNENDKWFLHVIHYADWLDARKKGFSAEQALEMIQFISSETKDPVLADKIMNFVHKNKEK